ncbi:hypothetical protein FB45DRAFT_906903 [Roridomyces roridus]|uniref:Spore coat protein U domain-containing protein n=1 Tax=Roridomyces roridus TaxID=1738132 RepID=A0AAD7C1S9_9AGAR|nr:hypothetical protein FB45DRAFT_906903 [Roridomyces roridus]
MRFNTLFFTALAGFITTAVAQAGFCPEAARFGNIAVSPSTLAPGQTMTITTNLTCAVELGDTPTFLDYYVDGSSEHNIGGPVLIARRTYDASTSPPLDTFTTTLPVWFYIQDATYSARVDNSFARPGPTGESVIEVGAISTAINITGLTQ